MNLKSKTGILLRKNLVYTLLAAVILSGIFTCQRDNYRDIDYSRSVPVEQMRPVSRTADSSLTLAIASIISAKESFPGYRALADYLQVRCGRKISITHSKTYREVYDLFANKRADFGFICSGLFVIGRRDKLFELFLIPVVKGKTTYQAYIIVTGSSPAQSLSDLIGKSFAFTDKLSLTGYFYPVFRVHDSSGKSWSETIFTGSHDKSVELINRGVVEGGSVDGLIYDDIARRFPERLRNTRIIEKSIEFGMPPVVIAPSMARQMRDCLRGALTGMHLSIDGRAVLQALGIDRFEPAMNERYDSIEKMVP